MKNFKFYLIAWAILIAGMNVIAFVVPVGDRNSGLFWPAYASVMVSALVQLGCTYYAFKNSDSKEKLFLNLPVITISYTGMIVSIIFGILALCVTGVAAWIGIVIAVVIAIFVAIATLKAAAAAEIVEPIAQKTKIKTAFIKMLTADAETLISQAKGDAAVLAAKKVYEAIRYSDPVSNEALAGDEAQVTLKFNEFAEAVKNSADNIGTLANELQVMVEARNRKCKLLK